MGIGARFEYDEKDRLYRKRAITLVRPSTIEAQEVYFLGGDRSGRVSVQRKGAPVTEVCLFCFISAGMTEWRNARQ